MTVFPFRTLNDFAGCGYGGVMEAEDGRSRSFVIISVFSDILIKFMFFYKNSCRRIFASFLALLVLLLCVACGSNNYYGYVSPSATSGFKHRIMVTNSYNGAVTIVNADNDQVYGRTISTSAGAQVMAEAHDGSFTLIYANLADQLFYIDNTIEDISGSNISLPGDVQSLAVIAGNTTAITASRNAPVNGEPNGAIYILDLTNRVIRNVIPVPLVRRIVSNHAGTAVLAFADNTNTAYVLNLTTNVATPIADPNGVLDRPVNAVFASDDTTAYIFSCGAECGGTQAKVTAVNATSGALGNTVAVSGATVGAIDSSGNLWVAGSPNGSGMLQSISTSALAAGNATPSTPVAIADGYHQVMAFTDDSRLYIGSANCTNIVDQNGNGVQGCLSIYNTSNQSVVKAAATGDVTGIQPIIGRHLAYVVQGGALIIYDTTKDAPRQPVTTQIDIIGQAYGILQIS